MHRFLAPAGWLWQYYQKHKGIIGPFYFAIGFILHNLNPKRIDVMRDNYQLLAYVVLAGILIIMSHLIESGRLRFAFFESRANWITAGIQFFMGGLFSKHVYFYFQSSAGLKSFLFIAGLMALLLINEFYKKKFNYLYLQFAMYFIACVSFFIFFLPIITKEMGQKTFLLGGAMGLAFTLVVLAVVCFGTSKVTQKSFLRSSFVILIIYILLNVFYFMRWIPPVPMALKHYGIYHHVAKSDYLYSLQFEKPEWYAFWRNSSSVYQYRQGDTVFCFTSIFAPTEMKKTIYYDWQRYEPSRMQWISQEKLSYLLQGGREGGYRGFSYKTTIWPGEWRIEITTEEDILLGELNFDVVWAQGNLERKMKTILR
ncbi:DUF2914 domain-containing protein [bacterium]|nr:MAG: DUF2914 domain-containing protein [bacterium]